MRKTLRFVLFVVGLSELMIALSIFFLGPGATAVFGEQVFNAAAGWHALTSPTWPTSMDNELRFYSVLWGAYAILMLLTARNIEARFGLVPWLAGVFFVGGLGRVLSWVAVGAPHPFFLSLMAIELILPPLLMLLWLPLRATHGAARG